MELTIKRIKSDHRGEFENHKFLKWCDEIGFKDEFSAPKTLLQNGVAEKKKQDITW